MEITLNTEGKTLIFYDFETEMIVNFSKIYLTRPIEVCMIITDHNYNEIGKINSLIKYRDGKTLSEEVTKLTGITQEDLDTNGNTIENTFEILSDTLHTKYPNHLLIGHNIIGFDNPILNYRLNKYGFKEINQNNSFDTAGHFKATALGWKKFPELSYYEYHKKALQVRRKGLKFNLGEVCNQYFITLDGWHRAEADVRACIEIFKKQYGELNIDK